MGRSHKYGGWPVKWSEIRRYLLCNCWFLLVLYISFLVTRVRRGGFLSLYPFQCWSTTSLSALLTLQIFKGSIIITAIPKK
jgi:hypothetical protein